MLGYGVLSDEVRAEEKAQAWRVKVIDLWCQYLASLLPTLTKKREEKQNLLTEVGTDSIRSRFTTA